MADSLSSPEPKQDINEEMLELNKQLEGMIEDVENISVQLTWMAYDMVIQRTSPEMEDSMRRLGEAYLRCRAAVCGEHDWDLDPEPVIEKCPVPVDPSAIPLTD